MQHLLRVPALFAVVILCGSCASTTVDDGVEVALANLRFVKVTPFETTADFTIRVQNQSPQALVLEGGVHKIHLNGIYVGSGVSGETLEIARFSEGVQHVEVHLRNLKMPRLVRDIIDSRKVDYRLESLLYAKVNARSARLRAQRAGVVDLKDFQPGPGAGGASQTQ